MIWGVYGDKNNGVCIELDYEKLRLPKNCFNDIVEYKDKLINRIEIPKDVVTINGLKAFIREHQKDLFFVKEKCWEYENEYRIISDTDEYLDISNAITAVYVANIDGLAFDIVDELLKNTDVKFEYVHVDDKIGILCSSDARKYKNQFISTLNNPKIVCCLFQIRQKSIMNL